MSSTVSVFFLTCFRHALAQLVQMTEDNHRLRDQNAQFTEEVLLRQRETEHLRLSHTEALAARDEARQAESAALQAVSLAMARADAAELSRAKSFAQQQRLTSEVQTLRAHLQSETAQRASQAAELQSFRTSMVSPT